MWVAKYRDNVPDYNYDMSNAGNMPSVKWWPFYAMWQWTSCGMLDGYSGSLDCDVFYGDKNTWMAYAKSVPAEASEDEDEIEKLKSEIKALEVEIDNYVAVIDEYKKRTELALKALKGEL